MRQNGLVWLGCALFLQSQLGWAGPIVLPPPPGSEPKPAPAPRESYKDIQAYLRKLVEKDSKIAKLVTIGTNDYGVPIEGIAIGDGPVNHLVVGTHHGNEYGSTEVAKAFAADLVTHPILGQRIFVVPVLNTGGFDSRSRHERTPAGKSIDPNRNYPGPCGGEGPFTLKSTAALAKFVETNNIVASATLHTYSPAVVYPWGFSTHDLSTPYDDLFKSLGQAATIESHYDVGNSAEAIYPANGTFEDWAFWKTGAWSMLFELGYSHSPGTDAVKEMIRVNVPGLRRMFEQSPLKAAENHAFTGKCDLRLMSLDRHDE